MSTSVAELMTADRWETMTDPRDMLRTDFVSPRQRQLFVCACVRQVWQHLRDDASRRAVELAEHCADHPWTSPLTNRVVLSFQRSAASEVLPGHRVELLFQLGDDPSVLDYVQSAYTGIVSSYCRDIRWQADLLRHIVGNPFLNVTRPERWPVEVTHLAEAAYAGSDCAFALHDALLDAREVGLAEHFGATEPRHPKGCWALDLILGKKR